MKNRMSICRKLLSSAIVMAVALALGGCAQQSNAATPDKTNAPVSYNQQNYQVERSGIKLHVDCTQAQDVTPQGDILLIHGVTYASHEFDVDYEDYSLVRFLAQNGWRVWRFDVAGFGQSDEVVDGFLPSTDYAADDAYTVAQLIMSQEGVSQIDVLGWSWGTCIATNLEQDHPDIIKKMILYAPIMSGLGTTDSVEPFHHNDWEHAASDFQLDASGQIDYNIADPVVVATLCSNSWRYDGESSPNGGRRDLLVSEDTILIHPDKVTTPTLVICGDHDPYLNMTLVEDSIKSLPTGSQLVVIQGGSHCLFIEKPYHQQFQEDVLAFLKS